MSENNGWLPIETAPAGKRLMVSDGSWFGPAVRLSDGGWFMWNSFFEPYDSSKFDQRPNWIAATHWQPLPPPPPETHTQEA